LDQQSNQTYFIEATLYQKCTMFMKFIQQIEELKLVLIELFF